MSEPIIGIDLGTTNSEVAIFYQGQMTVIADEEGKILPSVVGMSPDGALLVGNSAKNQYTLYPENTVLSIKRWMGTDEKVKMGDVSYLPQEISAMILKQLKSRAEQFLQCPVSKAVITVPAYFSDAQRQATREAGELAGLEVVRIINEPTAAALAYGAMNHDAKTILVYDLGGGTFDVSVVALQEQVVEVLASSGNNHLGGDDFDAKIIAFIEDHLKEHDVDISYSSQAKARIRRAAETAKIILSDNPFALIEEEYLVDHEGQPYHLSLELSREVYQELISAYIDETLEAVHQAIDAAKLMASDIDEVLLVGGSTRTPIISEKLSAIFRIRPRSEIDPELCVAIGAAIQAGTIAGEKCDAVLVDVTPYTFGMCHLGLLHGFHYPHVYKALIQKNTPIPVTKSEVFFTASDNQERINIHVYQGDNIDALQNIEIGEFAIEGLNKNALQGNAIVVSFKLDLDGILHVTAKEKSTGLEKKIVINNAMSQFNERELHDAKQRIEQLFTGNTDSCPVQDHQHESERALMKKAEKMLNGLSDEDQEDLMELMHIMKVAVDEHNHRAMIDASEKLSDMLFFLESNLVT